MSKGRYRWPKLRLVLACLAVVAMTQFATVVPAEAYTDPLDLPALKMEAAQFGLLLDVERAGDRLVAVGERGHILYSENQGKDWIQADVAARAHLTAVNFINDKLGWAVG